MTVSELIKKLELIEDKNQTIVLGVEGYTTHTEEREAGIGVYDNDDGYVFIADGCYYEEIDG